MSEVHPTIPPPPAADAATAWHAGIVGEAAGHLQNRGWDRLDAPGAAKAIYEAYRAAESRLGAPPEQLLRVPASPDDAEGWNAVYARLGKPENAADYAFEADFADPDLTAGFSDFMRSAAHAHNLTKPQAAELAKAFHKFLGDHGARIEAETTAAFATDREALEKSWGAPDGPRFKGNMFVADRAAEEAASGLGWDKATYDRMREAIADDPLVARLFHFFGSRMGEDAYLSAPGNRSGAQPMTAEQAEARWSEILKDKDWRERFFKGGAPERREWQALTQLSPRIGMHMVR